LALVEKIGSNISDYSIPKKSQENLTEEEKSILKKLVKSLREEAAKNRR
jgi:DNA replication initiation complex subunit (GINS family)